jgi:hypothetical protein
VLLTFLLCSAVFLLVFSWDSLFDSAIKGTIPPLYEGHVLLCCAGRLKLGKETLATIDGHWDDRVMWKVRIAVFEMDLAEIGVIRWSLLKGEPRRPEI